PGTPPRLGVAFEHPRADAVALAAAVERVGATVAALIGQAPAQVVAVRQGGLPRTPTGQVRRNHIRAMLLDGTLPRPAPPLRLLS
ncbi:MAG: hypothetical protein KC620_15355, partial [Myxococcales bacterium]|nr:hypothetical protein [Myxococcales bacterium]